MIKNVTAHGCSGLPNGDHDDGPDALEMAIRLAEEMFAEPQIENLPKTIYKLTGGSSL